MNTSLVTNLPPYAIDLPSRKSWLGLHPGMTRTEALTILRAAGAEFDDDPNDPCWLEIADWGMELRFTFGDNEDGEEEGDSQILRQIVLSNESCRWAGNPVIGEPLARVFKALGPIVEGCGWRKQHPQDDLDGAPEELVVHADEELLGSGTLWMRKQPLGLVLLDGIVQEIVWRRVEEGPHSLVSAFTPAQWAICERPDATEYLRKWRPARKGVSTLGILMIATIVLGLIGISVFKFQEQQHRQAAPHEEQQAN